MSTFVRAMKWKFGRNWAVFSLQAKIVFRGCDKVHKIIDQLFLSKGIPNFSTSCYIKKFANNMQLQATTTWACQNISKLKRNVCNGTVIRVLLKCSEPL